MAPIATPTAAPATPKANPPPPFPLLHTHVTVDQFSTPFPSGPWSINISAPSKGANDNDYSTLSAFMRGGMLKAWFKTCSSSFPVKGLYFGVEATQEKDKKLSVSPSVYYKFKKDGDNTVSFTPKTGRLSHAWMHGQGTFTTDVNANLYDYLSMDGWVSARLYPGVLGGFDFVYDPTRSGLKNYRLGLKYKMTHSVSYDATGTLAVSTVKSIIPGTLQAAAHLKSTRKGYEATVGLAAFSPCGAKVATKVQVHDGAAAVGVSRMIAGEWKVNIGVHGNVYKKTYSGVGVSLNYEQ